MLKPRGFCAGVVRAIDIVKIALETFGAPIYVRREIVHNRYVVNELAEKGAIFVHEIDDVPDGQRVIYSAHGVSPAVREISKGRHLKVIDATCPLVTKVHIEAVKFAKQGYSLILIGHRDHDEIEGTLGEAPEVTQVVSNVAEVDLVQVPDPNRVAYLTQTTLSLDEARDIIHALKLKFPNIVGPHSQDICYATENRQVAVRNVAHDAGLVLVVGSTNSSNSNRLVEVSRNLGTIGYLIDNSQAIDPAWLVGVSTVAVTAGASAPEILVEDVVNYLHHKRPRDRSHARERAFWTTARDHPGDWKRGRRRFGCREGLKNFFLSIGILNLRARPLETQAPSSRLDIARTEETEAF